MERKNPKEAIEKSTSFDLDKALEDLNKDLKDISFVHEHGYIPKNHKLIRPSLETAHKIREIQNQGIKPKIDRVKEQLEVETMGDGIHEERQILNNCIVSKPFLDRFSTKIKYEFFKNKIIIELLKIAIGHYKKHGIPAGVFFASIINRKIIENNQKDEDEKDLVRNLMSAIDQDISLVYHRNDPNFDINACIIGTDFLKRRNTQYTLEQQQRLNDPDKIDDIVKLWEANKEYISSLAVSSLTDLYVEGKNIEKHAKQIQWLIVDVLPLLSLISFFGPSQTYKSFLAIDMACHIAAGKDYWGKNVKQGTVVYICGEGFEGVVNRIAAWKKRHGIKPGDYFPIEVRRRGTDLALIDQIAILKYELKQIIEKHGNIQLVIYDTLRKNFSGRENPEGIKQLVTNVTTEIQDIAANMLINHTNLTDTNREANSAGFQTDFECRLQAVRTATKEVVLNPKKFKDVECSDKSLLFILEPQKLMYDDNGNMVTENKDGKVVYEETLVPEYVGDGGETLKKNQTVKKLKDKQQKLYDIAKKICSKSDGYFSMENFKKEVRDQKIYDRSDNLNRSIETMVKNNIFMEQDDGMWSIYDF